MPTKEFEIARLDVKPGDTLVAKYSGHLDCNTRAMLKEQLRGVFPEGVRVLVVDRSVDFAVISTEAGRAIDDGVLSANELRAREDRAAPLSQTLGES